MNNFDLHEFYLEFLCDANNIPIKSCNTEQPKIITTNNNIEIENFNLNSKAYINIFYGNQESDSSVFKFNRIFEIKNGNFYENYVYFY